MGFFKNQWVASMTRNMQLKFPEMDKSEIAEMVEEIYKEKFTDHDALLYNDYENEVTDVTLSGILDWIQTENPLICESGVFFYQKSKKRNINVEIIRWKMLERRKELKAEMFRLKEAGDVFGAKVKDLQQANTKKAANSGYGAEAERSSFLFNLHSAMSVTASGRGILSTACQSYDNLLADFVKFMNMDEFYVYINHIIDESSEWQYETMDIVDDVPTKKKFVKRFVNKFIHPNRCDVEVIEQIYDMVDDEMKCRLYYKSNLIEFMRNKKIEQLFEDIAFSTAEFVNPNKIPKELEKPVNLVVELITEFVNYKYSFFRYEDRTKYQKRSAVILMDTDSCYLYYGNIMRYLENALPKPYCRTKRDQQMFRYRLLNTLSCISTRGVHQTLWNYLGYCDVPEEDRGFVTMKNEFHLSTMVITFAKKSYIGLRVRQENTILDPPELDVKGVNFFKSTASEKTTKFIYDEILMKQILQSKDGKIRTSRIHRKIQKYQDNMAEEIKAGDMGYLKRAIRVKSPDAYKNPMRIGQYKAVYVWNKICEEKDRINLPATVTLVKVKLAKKDDVAALDRWPDIYERVLNLFETDLEIGGGVDANGNKVDVKGIKAIALPNDMDEVPDWILAIIDVDTLIGDNMKLFEQLYRPLGLQAGTSTNNGAQAKFYTNIIKI